MSNDKTNKLIIAITDPISIILLTGQLKFFSQKGYEVSLICSPTKKVQEFCNQENTKFIAVPIKRTIDLISDIYSLIRIIRIIKKEKPDIVNAGTPKASLLVLIASYLNNVPFRVYTCRGFRYSSESGIFKKILMYVERLTISCAHTVICISQSIKEQGIKDNIFKMDKAQVILKGSSNGIDLDKFYRKKDSEIIINPYRETKDAFVIGFVGRIIERKGINELITSFSSIEKRHKVKLLIVGDFEESQKPSFQIIKVINENENIHVTGWIDNVQEYLQFMDILVLPAYWEGFGNVLIQAAAVEIPVISTNTFGCKDAVAHGFNGLLVNPGSAKEIEEAIELYLTDGEIREKHAKNGPSWAANFDQQKIWNELNEIYKQGLLNVS